MSAVSHVAASLLLTSPSCSNTSPSAIPCIQGWVQKTHTLSGKSLSQQITPAPAPHLQPKAVKAVCVHLPLRQPRHRHGRCLVGGDAPPLAYSKRHLVHTRVCVSVYACEGSAQAVRVLHQAPFTVAAMSCPLLLASAPPLKGALTCRLPPPSSSTPSSGCVGLTGATPPGSSLRPLRACCCCCTSACGFESGV